MTVWQLCWALLRYAARGRGWQPVYAIATHLPALVQNEIDEHDLAVTGAHRPRLPGSRFVLVTVTPQVSTSEQREGKP